MGLWCQPHRYPPPPLLLLCQQELHAASLACVVLNTMRSLTLQVVHTLGTYAVIAYSMPNSSLLSVLFPVLKMR